jgi:hypothetical protein
LLDLDLQIGRDVEFALLGLELADKIVDGWRTRHFYLSGEIIASFGFLVGVHLKSGQTALGVY